MELKVEQIKKALEYCTSKFCFEGEGCPLVDVGGHYDTDECTKELVKNALALINEQEQRIKELNEERKDFEIRALRAENQAAIYQDRWETSEKHFKRLADNAAEIN